jgi:hypothetical protein
MRIYLKLDEVPGDSVDPGRADWINLESCIFNRFANHPIVCTGWVGRHTHALSVAELEIQEGKVKGLDTGVVEWVREPDGKVLQRVILHEVMVARLMIAPSQAGQSIPWEQVTLYCASMDVFQYGSMPIPEIMPKQRPPIHLLGAPGS